MKIEMELGQTDKDKTSFILRHTTLSNRAEVVSFALNIAKLIISSLQDSNEITIKQGSKEYRLHVTNLKSD